MGVGVLAGTGMWVGAGVLVGVGVSMGVGVLVGAGVSAGVATNKAELDGVGDETGGEVSADICVAVLLGPVSHADIRVAVIKYSNPTPPIWWRGFDKLNITGIPHIGSLQTQRAAQTRW